jgi:hypothetical protein
MLTYDPLGRLYLVSRSRDVRRHGLQAIVPANCSGTNSPVLTKIRSIFFSRGATGPTREFRGNAAAAPFQALAGLSGAPSPI